MRLTAAAAALAATIVLAAGCSNAGDDPGGAGTSSTGAAETSAASEAASGDASPDSGEGAPATVEIAPADDSSDVMPDQPVTVRVSDGELGQVTVADAEGGTVAGEVVDGAWRSTARLKPSAVYTVTARATGSDGTPGTTTSTFTTHEPDVTATYAIVYSGETVGVAMPASIQFDSPVTDPEYRKQVEKAVSVTTEPAVDGSWGWLDDRQLMWRPKEFFQPGTTVTIDAPLAGFQTGPDKWVADDQQGSMTIGRQQLMTVDIKNHRMSVERDGKRIKTFPISSGKPGPETETRSGMKVVIGKQGDMTMDSATVGIDPGEPGYYNIDTKWNVRVTWTGEFFHSAPWSTGAQGNSNVSHGCVNLAPENARWIYENTIPGDPADFTGSGREFKPDEGIGVWEYDWSEWQQQSQA